MKNGEKSMIKLFPSTNPSPEQNLINYIKTLQEAGVEFMHCDVMDGIFVQNKCLDIDLLKKIAEETTIGMDIHLMITEPLSNINNYINLPATYITTHYEAYSNTQSIIKMSKYIRGKNKLMGIAIKPSTPVEKLFPLLPLFDLVLILSVEPGMSGQISMEKNFEKIADLKKEIEEKKLNVKIQIDGGINESNMKKVVDYGADILVMGNAMYMSNDRQELIKKVNLLYRKPQY